MNNEGERVQGKAAGHNGLDLKAAVRSLRC